MPKRTHDGIKKRCECAVKEWPRCAHPWHFNFHHAVHLPPKGSEWRFNLNAQAGKPRGYVMPKTEARALRDQYRTEIANGTFKLNGSDDDTSPVPLTFGDLCDRYLERHVNLPTRRDRAKQQMQCYIAIIRRAEVLGAKGAAVRIEDKPIGDVTKADIDAVRAQRLSEAAKAVEARRASEAAGAAKGRPWEKAGQVGVNRLLARWRHVYNWAIVEGYAERTPFKREGVTVVKLNRAAETPRDRRLVGDDEAGEESRLLKAIQPYPQLQALFIAALETGCRVGELLTLQWRNVDLVGDEITLVSTRTKTAKTRTIPLTARLKAVIEMRRTDPRGKAHGADAYVFGNEVGEQIKSIKTEWAAVRLAAGVVNLKFHDLRREFGSRLLEAIGGNPVIVRDWLGHADLATTNRYLATTAVALRGAAKQFEASRGRGFAQDSHKPTNQPVPADDTSRSEVSEKSVS